MFALSSPPKTVDGVMQDMKAKINDLTRVAEEQSREAEFQNQRALSAAEAAGIARQEAERAISTRDRLIALVGA